MSYQVLARKWRPKTFDELAGQEHVLKALVNALENQRLHHAYLFTGTRGVGKTTIARILARSLNCETGITPSPCGTCSACQEINEGRFVDLIEVDAASRTKVEDTRDLLENVQYRPTRGRFKIYLIDEVHMLSSHSFNALLKTLEEPPEHVKFLLATTDPQKLPVTVLSRCLQFNLKNITSARIQEYLRFVLDEEKVPAEIEALWHLARAARGSMRDALSLTDQAISHGGGKLGEADVVAMLGTVDRKRIYDLMDALKEGDAQRLLIIAAELAEFSPDYFALIEEILGLIHAVALYQHLPESGRSEDFDQEKLAEYAKSFSAEDVQLLYQMLLLGQKDIAITPELHMGFEMLLLRLLAFQPLKMGERLPALAPDDEGNTAKKSEAAPVSSQRTKPSTEVKQQSEEVSKSTETASGVSVDEIISKTVLDSKPEPAQQEQVKPKIGSVSTNAVNDDESEIIDFSGTFSSSQDLYAASSTSDVVQPSPQAKILEAAIEKKETPRADEQQENNQQQKEAPNLQGFDEPYADIDEVEEKHQSMDEVYAAYSANVDTVDLEAADIESNENQNKGVAQQLLAVKNINNAAQTVDIETAAVESVANPESPKVIHSVAELSRHNWIAVFNQLSISGMVRTLCSHLVLDQIQDDNVYFMLAAPGQKIFEETHKQKFLQALSDYFVSELNVHIAASEVDQETPAEYAERRYREALIQAEEEILASPMVRKMVEEFDATLVSGSVRLTDSDCH